jgi:SnoaL-like protein
VHDQPGVHLGVRGDRPDGGAVVAGGGERLTRRGQDARLGAPSPSASSPREAFARIQQAALSGDGSLAELYAPDAVHEWPFPFPGASRRLSGRPAIEEYFQRMRAGGGRFRFERFDNVVVHDTTDPEVIVVEYDIHGTVAATDRPFTLVRSRTRNTASSSPSGRRRSPPPDRRWRRNGPVRHLPDGPAPALE